MPYYNLKEYLPLTACRDGYLYLIKCRNLSIGIYKIETKSFYGIRTKFNNRFIDDEYHWDLGEPFGTCKPVKELEKCPILIDGKLYDTAIENKWRSMQITNSDVIFQWLDTKLKELKF